AAPARCSDFAPPAATAARTAAAAARSGVVEGSVACVRAAAAATPLAGAADSPGRAGEHLVTGNGDVADPARAHPKRARRTVDATAARLARGCVLCSSAVGGIRRGEPVATRIAADTGDPIAPGAPTCRHAVAGVGAAWTARDG